MVCGDSDWSATANVGGSLNAALTVYYEFKPSVAHNILLASHFQTKCFWCLQDLTKVQQTPLLQFWQMLSADRGHAKAGDAAQRVKKKYSVSKRSRPPTDSVLLMQWTRSLLSPHYPVTASFIQDKATSYPALEEVGHNKRYKVHFLLPALIETIFGSNRWQACMAESQLEFPSLLGWEYQAVFDSFTFSYRKCI